MNWLTRPTPEARAKQKLQEAKILLQQHQENAEYHLAMVKMLEARVKRLTHDIEE